jgi:hypothetical protein
MTRSKRRKDCPVSVLYLKASGRLNQRHIIARCDLLDSTRQANEEPKRCVVGVASGDTWPRKPIRDPCRCMRAARRDPVMPCEAAGHPTPEKVIDAQLY